MNIPQAKTPYLRAVEQELLDLSWRRRRRYLAEVTEILKEAPSNGDPAIFAREFRDGLGLQRDTEFRPERSLLRIWPDPLTWILVGLTGVAVVLALFLAAEMIDRVGELGWSGALDRGKDAVLPIPRFTGSKVLGLITLAVGWAGAQLIAGTILARRPGIRRWVTLAGGLVVGLAVLVLGVIG